MARIYANIFCAIWEDEDFLALSSDAQRTYFMLVTQPDIAACGSLALTLRRWGKTMREKDRDTLRPALEELAEARFVLIDEDTEELLVRTFVKHDGGYKHAQRLKAVIGSARVIRSRSLRSAVAIELRKLGIETGTEVPPESHLSPTRQEPENGRVVVTKGEYVPQPLIPTHDPEPVSATPKGEPSDASAGPPPSMFCSKHPNGTEKSCGPCGTARKRYAAWMEAQTERVLAGRRLVAQAIADCDECDECGIRMDPDTRLPVGRCDHPAFAAAIAANHPEEQE